jgi:hypothetical protein
LNFTFIIISISLLNLEPLKKVIPKFKLNHLQYFNNKLTYLT